MDLLSGFQMEYSSELRIGLELMYRMKRVKYKCGILRYFVYLTVLNRRSKAVVVS